MGRSSRVCKAIALLVGFTWLMVAGEQVLRAQEAQPSAVPAPSLTLRQAIDQALGKNPEAAMAQADLKLATAGVSHARTGLLPRLNFAEDISRGNDPVYVFGTRLRQQRFTATDFALNSLNKPAPIGNFATRFSGSWMLFNWFGIQEQIHGAKFAVAGATAMSEQANQRIVLRVVEAYQAVLYAQRRVDVAQHEEATAEALLADATTKVHAGLAVDSDMLAAQLNLSERQEVRIAAEGDTDVAWAQLEAAMGEDTISPRTMLEPIQARIFPEGVLADDIASARKAKPDLKALRQQMLAEDAAAKAARDSLAPSVSAYGNWELDNPNFTGGGGNNWVAGVQLNLDIFPMTKRAQLAQQRAAQQKAEAQERAGEQQIRLAVNRAWTEHHTAERIVATAQASMQQSVESLRIVRNRYKAGLATMTDLLRAEDAQRRSQNDYWRAVYGNTVAYAALMYSTGNLTPDSAEILQ
ncbi:MAG: TolC family protein [Acidobacteriaceae bacterium]